jgi:hypothetical protein
MRPETCRGGACLPPPSAVAFAWPNPSLSTQLAPRTSNLACANVRDGRRTIRRAAPLSIEADREGPTWAPGATAGVVLQMSRRKFDGEFVGGDPV